MENVSIIQPIGRVERIIKNKNGEILKTEFKNSVLKTGRNALAASLANSFGDSYDYYISRMIFGDGGTSGGVPKFVSVDRNGLFGITRAIKPVISAIDPNQATQVIFTSILDYDEANGFTLNEMALQMNNNNLYSMATFADLNKTSSIQITWNWKLFFV